MFDSKPTAAYILSVVIVFLSITASAGGLLFNNPYQDNAFVTAVWKGNDLVTIFAAVPILIAVIIFSMRGCQHAQLIWFGMLDYTLYNFAFYLFRAAFNGFFLIYTALVALSITALIFGLLKIDVRGIVQKFLQATPTKWISAYMLFTAVGLTAVDVFQSVRYIFNSQVPNIIVRTGHITSVVPALDLTLLVPWIILGAVWLWRRQPWGYIITAILAVKGTVYTLALTSASLSASQAGYTESSSEVPLWAVLSMGFLAASALLLTNLRKGRSPGRQSGAPFTPVN